MKVKILQWNIWVNEDIKNIIKVLKKIKPDIVCAQEFVVDPSRKIDTALCLADALKYNYFFQQAETWDTVQGIKRFGNAIFSRFPIIKNIIIFYKSRRIILRIIRAKAEFTSR